MSEVLFYHLTETPLEAALPPLLEKSLERGWRVLVRGGDRARLEFLDGHLWTMRDDGFLPHGLAGGDLDADQPVLLSQGPANANDAQVLMLIDGADEDVTSLKGFERVCFIFDGNSAEALDHARGFWKRIKDASCDCTYWAQENGRWVKKA